MNQLLSHMDWFDKAGLITAFIMVLIMSLSMFYASMQDKKDDSFKDMIKVLLVMLFVGIIFTGMLITNLFLYPKSGILIVWNQTNNSYTLKINNKTIQTTPNQTSKIFIRNWYSDKNIIIDDKNIPINTISAVIYGKEPVEIMSNGKNTIHKNGLYVISSFYAATLRGNIAQDNKILINGRNL